MYYGMVVPYHASKDRHLLVSASYYYLQIVQVGVVIGNKANVSC
jgi:hypothetical protein